MPHTSPEDRRRYMRDYYARNAEGMRQRNRDYYKMRLTLDPAYNRRQQLRKYNLTFEQQEDMRAAQGGECAVCRRPLPLVVDHSHASGKVRGLLCDACNRGIGVFSDSAPRLRAAADYLDKY